MVFEGENVLISMIVAKMKSTTKSSTMAASVAVQIRPPSSPDSPSRVSKAVSNVCEMTEELAVACHSLVAVDLDVETAILREQCGDSVVRNLTGRTQGYRDDSLERPIVRLVVFMGSRVAGAGEEREDGQVKGATSQRSSLLPGHQKGLVQYVVMM